MILDTGPLVNTVGFDLVGNNLGRDIESALNEALMGGAIFHEGSDPLVIFRKTLASSIANIEKHPRGRLLQDFLLKGPYEDSGEIPSELVNQRLSDAETASAITFIYSHMVNSFKGAITELLATKPCMRLMRQLQNNGQLPTNSRLYVGDSVKIHQYRGKRFLKGGDQHILIKYDSPIGETCTVAGVTEVKSYFLSSNRLHQQLDRHLLRSKQGLRINKMDYPSKMVRIGYGPTHKVFRIVVLPSAWKLPRAFQFKKTETGRMLHVESANLNCEDEIIQTGDHDWRITLKWSKEALAQAAFEMTFWYMGKVGEVIYPESVPKTWNEMTPCEAGQNAVKMMLYYAMLRCNSDRQGQRAIALYNSYCFGYALGMNFKNAKGRREMLWIEDLDEILATGKTMHGCTLY